MARSRVLIVGVSTRAFCESALRAGYQCQTVDAFGDLDLAGRVEAIALARDLGRAYSAATVVAVGRRFPAEAAAFTSNLENHPAAVRRLARGRRLLGNSPAALAGARDFRELARVVQEAGGRTPLTLAPGDAPAASPNTRWLRKPSRGGGGSRVADWRPGAPLRAGDILQERVEGTLASACFAADGRRAVVLGLARGLAGDSAFGAGGYRYCGNLHPLPIGGAALDRLDAIVNAATRAFGLTGVNGVDFVLDGGGPVVLELNPRYSASMELIERRSGLSLFETHVAACDGSLPQPPDLAPENGAVIGKAVLWARRELVAGDTRRWRERDDVRDIPFPGDRISRGQPVCTVFAAGPDADACYARLVGAASALEAQLEALSRSERP